MSTEYPELTRRFFDEHGVLADVVLSYGATEAKVPDIADCVVEITETGRALRAAGLKIVETLLVSRTELIANPRAAVGPARSGTRWSSCSPSCRERSRHGGRCWSSSTSPRDQLAAVIELLPSLRAPTVSELFGGGGFAVETVVPKSEINVLIPALKDQGATDIIELALSKIVH